MSDALANTLAKQVADLLKRFGKAQTLTWPGTADGKGKGRAAKTVDSLIVRGVITERKKGLSGESTAIIILVPTKRSVTGASVTRGTRSYIISAVRELWLNDIMIAQEADLS